MPKTRQERQRNGMNDVRPDDMAGAQHRIENAQNGNANGSSPDRSERYDYTKDEAHENGPKRPDPDLIRGGFYVPDDQHGNERNGDSADDQGCRENEPDCGTERDVVGFEIGDGHKSGWRGGDAAKGQVPEDIPVDVTETMVAPSAAGFGQTGEKQIRADSDGWGNAKTRDQQWRRQRTGANARHSDQQADEETANGHQHRVWKC